jgi:hypothetical protein
VWGTFLSLSWRRWTFCVWVLIGLCGIVTAIAQSSISESYIELGFRCTLHIKKNTSHLILLGLFLNPDISVESNDTYKSCQILQKLITLKRTT